MLKLFGVAARLRVVFWATGPCKPYNVKLFLPDVADVIPGSVWTVTGCTLIVLGFFSSVCSEVWFSTATANRLGGALFLGVHIAGMSCIALTGCSSHNTRMLTPCSQRAAAL